MSHSEADPARADPEKINRAREAHAAAVNAGDAAAWAALFTEDGVQMPPNAPANVGRETIRRWSEALLSAFRAEFALSVEEVRVSGDWAFERGTYTIGLAPTAGDDPMRDSGKYITIYQRQPGGSWRLARDIWNSDRPLQGMP